MKNLVMLIVGAMLIGAPDTRAEQSSVFGGLLLAPQGAARASQNSGKSNPYSRLFRPAGRVKDASQATATDRATEGPTVKFGMRLIPGDSRIDSGIVARIDRSATKWHVRGIEPSICW